MNRHNPRLDIITAALNGMLPRSAPAFITVRFTEALPGTPDDLAHQWQGRVDVVAERVFTALYGRPDHPDTAAASPRAQAEDAKRQRDLVGEVGVLVAADRQMCDAPWYPARAGDLLHVAYEATERQAAWGETYVVERNPRDHAWLQLALLHHTPGYEDLAGCFAPGQLMDNPFGEPWFEAGPRRLTIIRNGEVVHSGTGQAHAIEAWGRASDRANVAEAAVDVLRADARRAAAPDHAAIITNAADRVAAEVTVSSRAEEYGRNRAIEKLRAIAAALDPR